MLDVNEYFNGKVKSISLQGRSFPAAIGVMSAGEYSFGTNRRELITVVCGELRVLFQEESEWQTFTDGQVFEVPANSTFKLNVRFDTAYLCKYFS